MKLSWPEVSRGTIKVMLLIALSSVLSVALAGSLFFARGWIESPPSNGWRVLFVLAGTVVVQGSVVAWLLMDRIGRKLAVIRKTTDRKVRERTIDLTRAKEEAEEATRLKSQFLASISHELRTPMHAILSFSRFGLTKADEVGPKKTQSYFENINESGTRLLTLLDDLLDLAKLESGKTTYAFESDDLLRVVQTSVEEFRCLADEKNCRVVLSEAMTANVQMDRKRMVQVVRNILSNAIKFSPENGTINLRVRRVDGAATVEIRDEGDGIPEEDLDGIFEKFVQARNLTANAGGTGLGLAICKEIVKAHNGDIWVYNHPRGGAVFVFSVPLYARTASSRGPGRSAPEPDSPAASNADSVPAPDEPVTVTEGPS